MAKVKKIYSREILDSRGLPTIETKVVLGDGSWGKAAIPTRISKGSYEAAELRDKDASRLEGMGVLKAVDMVVEKIAPKILGQEATNQEKIDDILNLLDASEKKEVFGANSLLSVSMAVCKAAADSKKTPLFSYLWNKYKLANESSPFPNPIIGMLSGGAHGLKNFDFQEVAIIPSSRFGFRKILEIAAELFESLRKKLVILEAVSSFAPVGGLTPIFPTNLDALEIVSKIISESSYKLSSDVFLGVEAAADHFYGGGKYFLKDRPQSYTSNELIHYYQTLNNQYHLLVLEDPLQANDWKAWEELNFKLGKKILVAGGDHLGGRLSRIKKAVSNESCSGLVINPTHLGTISETIKVIKFSKRIGWPVIISTRGAETNDDFVADFAVGVGASYVKFGALSGGERLIKYNRLLYINQEVGLD